VNRGFLGAGGGAGTFSAACGCGCGCGCGCAGGGGATADGSLRVGASGCFLTGDGEGDFLFFFFLSFFFLPKTPACRLTFFLCLSTDGAWAGEEGSETEGDVTAILGLGVEGTLFGDAGGETDGRVVGELTARLCGVIGSFFSFCFGAPGIIEPIGGAEGRGAVGLGGGAVGQLDRSPLLIGLSLADGRGGATTGAANSGSNS